MDKNMTPTQEKQEKQELPSLKCPDCIFKPPEDRFPDEKSLFWHLFNKHGTQHVAAMLAKLIAQNKQQEETIPKSRIREENKE